MAYDGFKKLRAVRDRGILTVSFDNPPVNVYDRQVASDLGRAIDEFEADSAARVLILRSDLPGWFMAHMDIPWRISDGWPTAEEAALFAPLTERIRTMPKVSIAVIEGRCGGFGMELTLSCDMRFAALETAIFNQLEVGVGSVAATGNQRIARLCGRMRAMEIILGADDFDAATAEKYALINRALPVAQLGAFVDRLARRVASWLPEVVVAAKASALRAESHTDPAGDIRADFDNPALRLARSTIEVKKRFLAIGGQTVEGESRLGDLIAELGVAPQ